MVRPSPSPALEALRRRVRALETPVPKTGAADPVLPFGDPRVDGCMPENGLPLGRLHEIAGTGIEAETGAVPAAFAAGLLARLSGRGAILWCFVRDDLYGPGLAAHGLAPEHVVRVAARSDAEVLSVLEEGLRTAGFAAVLGEVGAFGLTAGRRLQLACEHGGTTAFVLRRWPFGGRAARPAPTGAVTRWQVAPASSDSDEPGLGPPHWRVDLLHCRGGRPGSWIMEACDATGHVRVVAELADHPAVPDASRARAAG